MVKTRDGGNPKCEEENTFGDERLQAEK